jgi:hypothetical protein
MVTDVSTNKTNQATDPLRENIISTPTFVSSNTPSILSTKLANMIHSVAVTSKRRFVPAEQLMSFRKMSNDEQVFGVSIGRTHEARDREKDLPATDTGDNLHPVFSTILLSGHSSILNNYLNTDKNLLPSDLGCTPVKVISTNVRWPTSIIDESKDDDTYHTEFKMLSDLCQSHNMNPIDVLGLALATDNEIVKNERTFRNASNPFDYTESDKEELRYTQVRSTITTVGFACTEIVPCTSTTLPDDDSHVDRQEVWWIDTKASNI